MSSPRRARATRRPKTPPTNIMAWSSSTWSRASRPRPAAGRRATPASMPRRWPARWRATRRSWRSPRRCRRAPGSTRSRRQFPDRTFDVGIAEQHAVTFAAGLAAQGYKPFATIYSTFLQRAYDQVVHDVAIQNLPVRFAMDRAGLVGADGATHAGSFDLAYLCTLPNFTVMAAADEAELTPHGPHHGAARQRADRGALSARRGPGRAASGRAAGAGDRQGADRPRGQDGRDPVAWHAAGGGRESGGPARSQGTVDHGRRPALRQAAGRRN